MSPNLGITPRTFSFEPTQTFFQEVKGIQKCCQNNYSRSCHLLQILPALGSRVTSRQQFPVFRQSDVHHSEERYLELLDSFNGVAETYPPGVTDSFTWRYWTVSPDVTGQFHLTLLDRITWRYWTVSPGVTEPHHLMLLNSFTWRYWTVSFVITEPIWQFHLALPKPITWRNRTAIELFNMQRPTL